MKRDRFKDRLLLSRKELRREERTRAWFFLFGAALGSAAGLLTGYLVWGVFRNAI